MRPHYLELALSLGFDGAALKRVHPRGLTHRLAMEFYTITREDGAPTVDGVRFGSRQGDDIALWAIYERPGGCPSSIHLSKTSKAPSDGRTSARTNIIAISALSRRNRKRVEDRRRSVGPLGECGCRPHSPDQTDQAGENHHD